MTAQAPAGDKPAADKPAAQQPATPAAPPAPAASAATNKVTYTGCVKPGTAADSWILENAEAQKAGAPPSTVGTSGTAKMTLNLSPAATVDLKPHANHKVEVTGTVSAAKPSADAPAAWRCSSAVQRGFSKDGFGDLPLDVYLDGRARSQALPGPRRHADAANKVTYSGCVKPGTGTDTWTLENAEASAKPGASSSTVGTSGTSKMTLDLEPAAASVNLKPHANHKVEVDGIDRRQQSLARQRGAAALSSAVQLSNR